MRARRRIIHQTKTTPMMKLLALKLNHPAMEREKFDSRHHSKMLNLSNQNQSFARTETPTTITGQFKLISNTRMPDLAAQKFQKTKLLHILGKSAICSIKFLLHNNRQRNRF